MRLIDADKAIELIHRHLASFTSITDIEVAVDCVKAVPTADVMNEPTSNASQRVESVESVNPTDMRGEA